MIRRPRILITLDTSTTDRRGVTFETVDAKRAYGDQVAAAGGIPLFVAPTGVTDVLDGLAASMDGLVITGGDFDIPPEAYGASATANGSEASVGPRRLDPPKPERTGFERSLLEMALGRRCPVLGVCGGMQLINVALGGTLLVDIATDRPHALDHEQPTSPRTPGHGLHLVDRSRWAARVGDGPKAVNSTHHQAVDRVASSLEVWAEAPDGIIEAIASRKDPDVVGVQWHPELLDDALSHALYGRLVAAARERMV